MTNEELVIRIQKETDENTLNNYRAELWEQNRNFVCKIAKNFKDADKDDAIQESYFALLKAVDYYDAEKGSFCNVYKYFILRSLYNISKDADLSFQDYQNIKKYNKIVSNFEKYNGRTPTRKELCIALFGCYSQANYNKTIELHRIINSRQFVFLDAELPESDSLVGDTIPSGIDIESDILDKVQREQLQEEVHRALCSLPEEEQRILQEIYFDEKTLSQCADVYGITPKNVALRRDKALKHLKTGKYSKKLQGFIEYQQNQLSRAYKSGYRSFIYEGSKTENLAVELIDNEQRFIDKYRTLINTECSEE